MDGVQVRHRNTSTPKMGYQHLILIPLLLLLWEAPAFGTDYTLTVTAINGTVMQSPSGSTFASGTVVRLIPRPAVGYSFRNWSGDINTKRLVIYLTMDSNKSVTANFGTWMAPVGVPTPPFGIFETYRMYDAPGNRNSSLTYYASPDAGYYTAYVDNTHPNATDTDNAYGTAARPRKTLPFIYPGGLLEGSVVEVHGGPYGAQNASAGYERWVYVGGTSAKPIFIRGVSNPVIYSEIILFAGSYTIFEGFTCINTKLGVNRQLAADHICFRSNDVSAPNSKWWGSGITLANGGNTYMVAYRNHVHHNGDVNDPDENDLHGISVTSSYGDMTKPDHCWVVDNIIHENHSNPFQINSQLGNLASYIYFSRNICWTDGEALGIKECRDVVISENDMFDYRASTKAGGTPGYPIGVNDDQPNDNVYILANTVHHCANGISYQLHCNIIGNLIYNIHDGLGTGTGVLGFLAPGRTTVYGNTIYNVDRGIAVGTGGDANSAIDIVNNIIMDVNPTKQHIQINAPAIAARSTMNHNLLYQTGGTSRIAWGTYPVIETLAQFQVSSELGEGCVEADPLFVDASNHGDFRLQSGSPAIDAGGELTLYDTFFSLYGIDIKQDIEARLRTGDWDLGAYEYVVEAVSDLAVSGMGQNFVTLAWTVPGEDGVTGTPARYDIRYANASITEANWDAATQVQGESVPGIGGARESFTITGLNPGTTYHIALKTGSQTGGATSSLSNVVSATTAITAGNYAPVMEPVGDQSVAENGTLTFVIRAADVDGDTLTYSATNLPGGARFDSGTRTFTWTPTTGQRGTYGVAFSVNDSKVTVSETVNITVTGPVSPENRAPVLAAIGDQSVVENASLSFSLGVSDADGDSLTFTATGLPTGAHFENGTFSWVPGGGQAGSYPVDFSVSDGEFTDSQRVTITVVQAADRRPPTAQDLYPAADEIQVSVNPLIAITLSDPGSGVDGNTVNIQVDGQIVYAGDRAVHETAYGTCRRTGTTASYGYSYHSAYAFDFDQQVSVRVSASDRARNAMMPVTYQFVTEMQSFGGNELVSSDSGSASCPAVATDSQGNIWAAWHAGQTNARDIYIAKRSDQAQRWDSPLHLTNLIADQCNPAISVGPNGAVYVVWQDNRRGNWDVYLSIMSDGRVWQEPVRITDSNDSQTNPVIAVDHGSPNRVYIAWEDDGTINHDVYLASSSTSFASKQLVRITSDAADQTAPALAVGSDNTVYLVWTDRRNGTADVYGTSSNTSSWANMPVVTEPGNQLHPAIVAEPGTSRLHMLWVDDSSGNLDVLYGVSEGLPNSPIVGHTIIDDTTNTDQSAPAIVAAKDQRDNTHVYACWQDSRSVDDARDTDLYFVEIRSGSGGTNILVGDDGTNSGQSDPVMAFDGYGQPAILWIDDRESTPQVYGACSTYFKPEALVSQSITQSAGGRVGADPDAVVDGNDVSITVPPEAYVCDTVLSISQIQNFPRFAAPCIAGFEISPSGVQFSSPATVIIPYANSASGQAIPYWYDAQTGTLSQQGITEITNTKLANGMSVVSFKTTHLTPYYVLEGSGSETGGGGGGGCALASGGNAVGPLGYMLPYVGVAVAVAVWRWRDRRARRHGG